MQRASDQFIYRKNKYKIEKGDYAKTFLKGDKSKARHSQPISNVLTPSNVRP